MKNLFRKIPICACLLFLACFALGMPEVNAAGATISGHFDPVSGYDIATVRYIYTENGAETYGFAEIAGSPEAGYTYSFSAPTDDFAAVEGSDLYPVSGATVVAEYYDLGTWDGAVDVSWYNETDDDFYLYTPAELAGLAAIVNGSVDGAVAAYQVKGDRSSPADTAVNRGLPDCIESDYFEKADLIAGVVGSAYKGVMKHDFANRTIHIMADMDMGGVDGSEIDMGEYDISVDQPDSNWNRNLYDYPNWTPIGGEYLMDVTDSESMVIAFFNGTIDGHGHNIKNLYCYRWSYRSVGETAYGYSQGVGFVGDMGTLYDDERGREESPDIMPAVRNLGLSGFVYGRRMVGGFVGCIGGGSNAADGTSVNGGICLENLANHAYVYCTDSKGLGGIVGCSMTAGSIINCYNDGVMYANYSAPTGGIIGSNESMDIFCCYNVGSVYGMQSRGRGIGSDNAGRNYTVDNCFYLENCGNDPVYPGYYAYNLSDSVHVNVTELSEAQMKSQTLLSGLNQNGTAFVAGNQGYPVLYWEKEHETGSLSTVNPQGGTVTAVRTGVMENGSVVYLSNSAETGWNFRYYTLNGNPMTGDYVTVNGESVVSAYFESVKAGVLNIGMNSVCDISVTKNGVVIEDGVASNVSDYPVQAGDVIYEGDVLIVQAKVREGMVPDDPGLSYRDTVGAANPFEFRYNYTGGSTIVTNSVTFTVGPEIHGENVSLTLSVVPLTTQKLWKYQGDTSWYDENKAEFVITTPEQLAGLANLVSDGVSFAGKTVKLGNDISLENNDGSGGKRYWDGIGAAATADSSVKAFAGTFDGQGFSITGYHGCRNGLFSYCYGASADEPAVIKNLSLYGDAQGQNACGIAAYAKYAKIENCSVYCIINGDGGYSAGIVGYAQVNCDINDCCSYGGITATGKVGGIAGEISTKTVITNCINKGDIVCCSNDGNSVGGIVGSLNGQLVSCANYGNISAWSRNVGGVAGQSVSSASAISDCYNVGSITLEKCSSAYDCVGGIVGYASYYKVSNSFNYGSILTDGASKLTGSVFGREAARSASTTSDVYYLDSSYIYAENNLTYEELPDLTYCSGIRVADQNAFADAQNVLSSINENGSFVLTNGMYPELCSAAQIHSHSGGNATCVDRAVCEICGLPYGETDENAHGELVLRNVTEAAWIYDGYTGDQCCRSCGAVVISGETIPADTTRKAITINVYSGTELVESREYTVAEFDRLKTVDPYIVYAYGGQSEEIMVSTEYVTIMRIAQELGYSYEQLQNLEVICPGVKSTLSGQELLECSKYYDSSGTAFDAPAAIAITYTTLSGTPDVVVHEAQPSNSLRFGYGISETQYEEQTALGGKRLISPVNTLNLYMAEETAGVSGTITGYSGSVSVKLYQSGVSQPVYETTGVGSYSFASVTLGEYTLEVSADGLYVTREYEIVIGTEALKQDVAIYQLGDVNLDGEVKVDDATVISRHVARTEPITDAYILLLADTNRDGKVSVEDVTHLARYLARIDPEL